VDIEHQVGGVLEDLVLGSRNRASVVRVGRQLGLRLLARPPVSAPDDYQASDAVARRPSTRKRAPGVGKSRIVQTAATSNRCGQLVETVNECWGANVEPPS
jgi:hypothetical protein